MTVFRREQPLSTIASSEWASDPNLSHSLDRVYSKSCLDSLLSMFVTVFKILTALALSQLLEMLFINSVSSLGPLIHFRSGM